MTSLLWKFMCLTDCRQAKHGLIRKFMCLTDCRQAKHRSSYGNLSVWLTADRRNAGPHTEMYVSDWLPTSGFCRRPVSAHFLVEETWEKSKLTEPGKQTLETQTPWQMAKHAPHYFNLYLLGRIWIWLLYITFSAEGTSLSAHAMAHRGEFQCRNEQTTRQHSAQERANNQTTQCIGTSKQPDNRPLSGADCMIDWQLRRWPQRCTALSSSLGPVCPPPPPPHRGLLWQL